MNVGSVCRRDIVTITVATPLVDAARLLCDGRGDAIVAIASSVRQPTAVGIVTDRDILRAVLERGGDLSGSRVLDILPRDPLVLSEDEEIEDAMSKLLARGIEHAPVIGPGGTLCGAISQRDLLAASSRLSTALGKVSTSSDRLTSNDNAQYLCRITMPNEEPQT